MLKAIAATALAAYIAYDVTVAPGHTEILSPSSPQSSLNDRWPIGLGCEQAWPNYDSKCVRSRTHPNEPPGQIRQVRIVAIDRQPAKHSSTPFAK